MPAVEIGYSVEDITALKGEATTDLVDGFVLFVRSVQDYQQGVPYTYWSSYTIPGDEGGIVVTDIVSDYGTILIRPNSGDGYWAAPVGHIHSSNSAPASDFSGAPVGVCHWLQTLSSPSRRVLWTWVPGIIAWIKSGPPVVASGVPTFTPDFTGQRYVNSSTGDDYYHNGTAWVLAGSGGGGGSYTDEQAQDAVGTILADSTSINLTYNGSTPSITAEAIFGTTSGTVAEGNHGHSASAISNFSEAVDDRVNAMLQAGDNITLTYNDGANTLTIASTGGGGGGGGPVVTTSGLVAWYKCDEMTGTALGDSSGNANSGTLTGSMSWTPLYTRGLSFNGGYVDLPDIAWTTTGSITIEIAYLHRSEQAWIRLLTLDSGPRNSPSNTIALIASQETTRLPLLELSLGTGNAILGYPSQNNFYRWRFISFEFDNSADLTRTFEGLNLVNSATTAGGAIANVTRGESYIGRSLYDANPNTDMILGDLRIYDRVLTTAERIANYRATQTALLAAGIEI